MKTKLKFFLVFLAMTVGGVNSVWGRGLFFANSIVELEYQNSSWTSNCSLYPNLVESFTVNGITYLTYEFQQDVLWEWYKGDTPINLDNPLKENPSPHTQDKEPFQWSVDVHGSGITIPEDFISEYAGSHYQLNAGVGYGSHIRFTLAGNETSGYLTVTVLQPDFDFDHLAYSASYTIKINQTIHSRKWDFYTSMMDIGRSNDNGSVENNRPSSKLYDIKNASVLTKESTSGFDVEGTNALFWYNAGLTSSSSSGENFTINYSNNSYSIPEADGLKFYAPSGNIGIANDEDASATSAFRYIALKPGASFFIPHGIFENWIHPRVRIKMGRYGGTGDDVCIELNVTNAYDALGSTEITDIYKIGGSAWWGDKEDYHQRGEYHFVIKNKSSDFKIEVHAGQWLMLYSIEVYDSEDIITENSLLGDRYQLLNIAGSGTNATGSYYLHYRGKGETCLIDNFHTTGTIGELTSSNFTTADGGIHYNYTATNNTRSPKFGTFRMRMKCYTMDNSNSIRYCTDFASRTMSVGFREKMTYPYTWDLADVHSYKYTNGYGTGDGRMGTEGSYYHDNGGVLRDQRLWIEITSDNAGVDNRNTLNLSPNGGHDVNYCGGSQLWYGTTMIPEVRGLGFTPVNYDQVYNSSLTIQSGSMKFSQEMRDWWGWRVTVPSVPNNNAVYIRAKDVGNSSMRHVKYYIGSGVNNKTEMTEFAASSPANKILVQGTTDEYVYAVYNNSGSENDITLFFNEVEVKKIAVSEDAKQFNAKGWTTESRARDIDPSLTAYMNGRNIKTYLVTNVDYPTNKVTMTEIGSNSTKNNLMHAATDGSKYACILRNTEEAPLNIVNSGFYLFVPDMHDEQGETEGSGYKLKNYHGLSENSIMKAQVSATNSSTKIPATSGDYTNFAFTYQYYDLDARGYVTGSIHTGEQAFYRISKEGASSVGNQGYLPLETSKVPNDWTLASRGFTMDFGDGTGESQETTTIATLQNCNSKTDAVYYNLNGQKLEGKPAHCGIYVVNGKKIFVK